MPCTGDCLPNCRSQVVEDLRKHQSVWAQCTLDNQVNCESRTCSHLHGDSQRTCRERCTARAAAACALTERKAKKCMAACGAHLCVDGACTCPVIAGNHRKCEFSPLDWEARLHPPEDAHCFQTFWEHASQAGNLHNVTQGTAEKTTEQQGGGDDYDEMAGVIIANASDLPHGEDKMQRLKIHTLNRTAWLSARDDVPTQAPIEAARHISTALYRLLKGMEAAWRLQSPSVFSQHKAANMTMPSITLRMAMRTTSAEHTNNATPPHGRRAMRELSSLSDSINRQLPNEVPLQPTDNVPETDLRQLASWDTCAVVGSSGVLAGSGLGPEIDTHAAVIRFNKAPTEGYEADVGSRTTLRLQNNRHCGWCERGDELLLPATDYRIGRCYQYVGRPVCRLLVLHQNLKDFATQRSPRSVFQRTAQHLSHPAQHLAEPQPHRRRLHSTDLGEQRHHAAEDGETLKKRKPLGKTLSAGFFGIQLAMHLCGRVSLYGFSEDQAQHYYASFVPAMQPDSSAEGLVKVFTGKDAHNWGMERHCVNVYRRHVDRFQVHGGASQVYR
eukprot:jgi/Tetstr1/429074/TSEL_019038.t1